MTETVRKLMMLKPMQTGLSGYARLNWERGQALVQINLRGLRACGFRAFWYAGDGETVELGTAAVNSRGEAQLTADMPDRRFAPERLQALLVVENRPAPKPLMIGLCVSASAGSLLDAKNASLSLCEKLRGLEESREGERAARRGEAASHGGTAEMGAAPAAAAAPAAVSAAHVSGRALPGNGASAADAGLAPAAAAAPAAVPAAHVSGGAMPGNGASAADEGLGPAATAAPAAVPAAHVSGGAMPGNGASAADAGLGPAATVEPLRRRLYDPPREIFLPAIDPLPYVTAAVPLEEASPAPQSAPADETGAPLGRPAHGGEPVDRLPKLRWPSAFASLRGYFDRLPPCAVLPMPGWRFVCASREGDGLWIGVQVMDAEVKRVAYASLGRLRPGGEDGGQRVRGLDGQWYDRVVQRG